MLQLHDENAIQIGFPQNSLRLKSRPFQGFFPGFFRLLLLKVSPTNSKIIFER